MPWKLTAQLSPIFFKNMIREMVTKINVTRDLKEDRLVIRK